MLKCYNCGGDLKLVEETTKSKFDKKKLSKEDDSKVYIYKCEKCGSITRVENAPPSEQVEGDLDPCECEHNFDHVVDYTFGEFYNTKKEDNRIVNILTCRMCGSFAYCEHAD